MLQVERVSRPRKSISKSLIIQQQEPVEHDNTGKAKEHFQNIKQKLKAIPKVATPVPSPKEQTRQKRRDRKGKKQKQQKTNFQLEVSESSSEESFEIDQNEVQQAKENLKKLSKSTNQNKNNSSFINSPLFPNGKNESGKYDSQQATLNHIDGERVNINFVKSLEHNAENKDIQEHYEEGYLNINIQSDDLLTFLRYEHEVQEMIHRSKMFAENKIMHEGLQSEIENYEKKQEQLKLEKEERQKEFVQRILLQEQQKQNFLQRAKTKKIGDIAHKFIDRHHIEYKFNDPLQQGHLSKRKQEF